MFSFIWKKKIPLWGLSDISPCLDSQVVFLYWFSCILFIYFFTFIIFSVCGRWTHLPPWRCWGQRELVGVRFLFLTWVRELNSGWPVLCEVTWSTESSLQPFKQYFWWECHIVFDSFLRYHIHGNMTSASSLVALLITWLKHYQCLYDTTPSYLVIFRRTLFVYNFFIDSWHNYVYLGDSMFFNAPICCVIIRSG